MTPTAIPSRKYILALILKATGAHTAIEIEVVQRLWRGYGNIVRYGLTGGKIGSVIVKHVQLPPGKGQELSHARKVRSYQVETAWYGEWSRRCGADCRVPACLAAAAFGDQEVMVLEDLDAAGYFRRRRRVGDDDLRACLSWLANFHATFLGEAPSGLWPTGSYWHLETRPDEWRALSDQPLKRAAPAIDRLLRASPYQTFVHGDAKLDNFCFSEDGGRVAAVDFQYVGGGPGIKDVAYFLDSCLDGDECQHRESELLDVYLGGLKQALSDKQKSVDAEAVEHDWRELYPVALADFHRFLKGWSPGQWDCGNYRECLTRQVVAQLQNNERKENALVGE